MPKTFEELFPEGLTEPQDVAPVSADVSATIAPGELTTAGILSVDQEERGDAERAWDVVKATGRSRTTFL